MSKNALRVFDGGVAVVTGGASGIGRALAEELASRGCEVVVADRQTELAEEVVSAIREAGGTASAFNLDVTDYEAVENMLRETVERSGRLDFMFNNAGIGIGGPVGLHNIEDWRLIVDVNLMGVVNGVQSAYPIMAKQEFGHIVNTASLAGLVSVAGSVAYASTKHGVVGLSKSLRSEVASEGIRVSVLCPSVIRTPILNDGGKYGKSLVEMSPEQEREMWEKRKPMPADLFAVKALDAIAKNKAIVVLPSRWKVLWGAGRISPSLGMYLDQKGYEAAQKD